MQPSVIKEIKFNFGVIQLLSNSIVRLEIFDDVLVSLHECRVLNNAIGEINNNQLSRVLMVPNENTNFTSEAREFSASEEGLKFTIADALISKNLAHKILINFYLKFNKPPKPSRVFENEEEAMEWLLTM